MEIYHICIISIELLKNTVIGISGDIQSCTGESKNDLVSSPGPFGFFKTRSFLFQKKWERGYFNGVKEEQRVKAWDDALPKDWPPEAIYRGHPCGGNAVSTSNPRCYYYMQWDSVYQEMESAELVSCWKCGFMAPGDAGRNFTLKKTGGPSSTQGGISI